MRLFRSSPQTKRAVIFHVGSSAIIGAHVIFDITSKRAIPEITHGAVVPIPITKSLSTEQLIKNMQKSLREAGNRLVHESIGSPDKIICFLESPWYAAQVRSIKISKHVPFTITEKLIKDLVKKEVELFGREYVRADKDILIEKEITDVKLNGYATPDFYGKKAKELSIGMVLSIAPRELLTKMQDQIGAVFHRKEVRFRTFAHAGSMVTRDLFITMNEFVFVDVGGEVTDIVLVKDNMYAETISFPWGTNTLYRAYAHKKGCSLADATSELSVYLSGVMHGTAAKSIERVLEPLIQEWSHQFGVSLEKIAKHHSLPHTIALLTEPLPFSGLFKTTLLNETRIQHTLTAQAFTVVELAEVPWHNFTQKSRNPHPRGAIAALLVAKYMDTKL